MAKKSLGQNFLKNDMILRKIRDAAEPTPDQIILEIGPGKGAITKHLLPCVSKLIAIEADRELIPILQETFADYIESGVLDLRQGDIMEFDETVLRQYNFPYALVANIPYYLTGAIIRKFLESAYQPESMTLVIQKEVAQRIVAHDKKESILSMSVKAYGKPRLVDKIPARYFSPKPRVDSAIIHISDISKDYFDVITEQQFFTVVKSGFAQKRKMVTNNLKLVTDDPTGILERLGISTSVRAEDLCLEDWKKITLEIFK